MADCAFNAQQIIQTAASCPDAQLIVFPELCITGYTCGDLFLQQTLQEGAVRALELICDQTKNSGSLIVAGLPVTVDLQRYNCAAFIHKGRVLAVVPKTYIPNYSEFYERRWFTPAGAALPQSIRLTSDGALIPFGTDILLRDSSDPRFTVAAEICEDAWVPLSPSVRHALAGATVIANLSASNEVVGKAAYRRTLVSSQSAKTMSAYLYADAGHDESTTDMVFSGHNIIACDGKILSESAPFAASASVLTADIDLERIAQERLRTTTFADCAAATGGAAQVPYRIISFEGADNPFTRNKEAVLTGGVDPRPFVPASELQRRTRCTEVVDMQAQGLAKRLRHIHAASAVIGLSGGLDSTLALLVTCRAFDLCGIDRRGITAVTMPCFGTTDRTYRNACALAQESGVQLREVRIADAVRQHFKDIGHDEAKHDVTYENSQARERTQVLMDIANQTNGIVIGTGDLSELALGWATYNGDHMSMYGVNASIPKTLVKYLVSWFADDAGENSNERLQQVLLDILSTPVSPELLPPEKDGTIAQKTEDLVGPYELHDFFLYYVLRFGYTPSKILFLAEQAFCIGAQAAYSRQTVQKWLVTFYRRFFAQQFKRSCMPDGAKVGTVSLSPRGDWRMPSDASAALWLKELEDLSKPETR